jgi:hypothetical protein
MRDSGGDYGPVYYQPAGGQQNGSADDSVEIVTRSRFEHLVTCQELTGSGSLLLPIVGRLSQRPGRRQQLRTLSHV